ncbi:MAG: nif-specific transcriptional activator NifA [Candidatus Omnitrophota bacterium]
MKKGSGEPARGKPVFNADEKQSQVLFEVASALNSSLDLQEVMTRILNVLHHHLGMERGTLTLLNPRTHELAIEVAHGLDADQRKRGRYRLGEGITGRVVAEGEAMAVPNIGAEPLFLNRTRSRGDLRKNQIAFLCVPIKLERQTIGALSVDKLFQENISFEEDIKFLSVIGALIAQAARIHQLIDSDKESLKTENILLKTELRQKFRPDNILGESGRMKDVYASLALVSQTRATVLIRGESGTGKELVAHAIHYASDRAEGPFVKVSCAALPDTLLESELFGYEKGAFTGAAGRKIGRFEMANGGTLFLDEIGDIPATTQIKLLRVLQEKEFERVGGTATIRADLRLITATNRDLEKLVREGKFREDLYYRLNVVPIFLPPLRDRKEDIPLLVNHFLKKANQENGKKAKYISDEAMNYLMQYGWPGNVRELENVITRAVILCKGDTVTPDLFPIPGDKSFPVLQGFNPPEAFSSLEEESAADHNLLEQVAELEKRLIRESLAKTGGNQRQTAKKLGITERILGYKIKKYGLK